MGSGGASLHLKGVLLHGLFPIWSVSEFTSPGRGLPLGQQSSGLSCLILKL